MLKMNRMNRFKYKIITILVITSIFIAVFSGCMFLPQEEDLLPFDLLQPADVTFTTMPVERGSIQHVLRDQSIAVSAVFYNLTFENRSGYLVEMNVTMGQAVEEGDVLARLDTGNLELDIRRQEIFVEKSEINLTEARRSGSWFSMRQATLDLELANLTLQQLTDEYEKASIVAPHDGEIVFIADFRIGDFVPGRRTVITLADPKQVQFEYTGHHSRVIRYGMEAEIALDQNTSIPVRVSMTPHTAPAEERERYRDTVIFTAINPDDIPETIRLGRRYEFRIILEEKDDVIVLPRAVVSTFMGQYYVQILEDGMRMERDLIVGIVTDREIEVVSGLEENDEIITGIER